MAAAMAAPAAEEVVPKAQVAAAVRAATRQRAASVHQVPVTKQRLALAAEVAEAAALASPPPLLPAEAEALDCLVQAPMEPLVPPLVWTVEVDSVGLVDKMLTKPVVAQRLQMYIVAVICQHQASTAVVQGLPEMCQWLNNPMAAAVQ
jgi:hypothetical protein